MNTARSHQETRSQRDEIVEFLCSDSARSLAVTRIHRYGLNYEVDDLLATVAEKLLRRLQTGGLIGDGLADAIPRYVNVAIKHTAIDLLRAQDKSRAEIVSFDAPWPHTLSNSATLDLPDVADCLALELSLDTFRSVAQMRIHGKRPWLTAAILAHLAVDECPGVPLPERIVFPEPGSESQTADWVALQYAGLTRCFERPETAAVRKRRSKAAAQLRQALIPVVEAAQELS